MEELPEESIFISENRATVPAARGPLVNTSRRALGATGASMFNTSGRALAHYFISNLH
jgi:hypothetical protein